MSPDPGDFDLGAAAIRRARGDLRAFLEALAARLEGALPGSVEVERRRDGLFSRTRHVARIAVRFEASLLTLELDGGHLRAKRAKVVRGVTIGTEDVDLPAWLAELLQRTESSGARAGEAHGVLHDFLLS